MSAPTSSAVSGDVSSVVTSSSSFSPTTTSSETASLPSRPPESRPSGGGGNGNGGGMNPNFASPAASNLYLYTFLATLLLLLLVSGCVVGRSVRLRMRARRAIEESIRNGTFNPPPRNRAEANARKPVFYDASIKEAGAMGATGAVYADEKQNRWENLIPVTAAFVPSKNARPLPHPATSAPVRPRLSLMARIRRLNPFRAIQLQDILDELSARDVNSRMVIHQQAPTPTQAELASAAFRRASATNSNSNPSSNANDRDTNTESREEIERPSAVRVAVLVAMPDPSRPTNVYGDPRSSSTSVGKGKSRPPVSTAKRDEEPEIPYVEFGIAEVPFASVSPQPGPASQSQDRYPSSPSSPERSTGGN